MMTDFAKVTTMTANSTIDNTVAVGMRATLNEDGTWALNKTIRNTTVYMTNKTECDNDYEKFETKVLTEAQKE